MTDGAGAEHVSDDRGHASRSASTADGASSIEVRTRAPFSVGVVLWKDEGGRLIATVVAKATFALDQEVCALCDDPDPIQETDAYRDGDAETSVHVPSDLAPFKHAAEVIVVGSAHAVDGHPADRLIVRVAVGSVDKVIEVTAPRRFNRERGLEWGGAARLLPLRYEVASGGPGSDNPVGIDARDIDPAGGHALPQIQPANFDPQPGQHVPIVGLGPVAPHWPQRQSRLRHADRAWIKAQAARPRPTQFDPRYFNVTPPDQQTDEPFRSDERLILEGLHPHRPRLVTNLAGVAPRLLGIGVARKLPELSADTLYIDTDRQIVNLTYRCQIALDRGELVVEVVEDGIGEQTSDAGPAQFGITSLDLPIPGFDGQGPGAEGRVAHRRPRVTQQMARASTTRWAGLPFAPQESAASARSGQAEDGVLPFSQRLGAMVLREPRPSAPPAARPSSAASAPPPSVAALPPPSVASVPPPAVVSVPPARPSIPPALVPPPIASAPPAALSLAAVKARSEMPPSDAFRAAFGGVRPSAPPAPPPSTQADAGLVGVKAASDAAARASSASANTKTSGEGVGAGLRFPTQETAVTRRALIDVLDFDDGVPRRMRRSKVLLRDFTPPRPLRRPHDAEVDGDDRARLDVLRVLSCGQPVDGSELGALADRLLGDANDVETPLFLVEGELRPTMDELEAVKTWARLAKPIGSADKRIQAALVLASEVVAATPQAPTETVVATLKQLAAAARELSLGGRPLAEVVQRQLVESRSFKRRVLFGAPHIRADLAFHSGATMPLYLADTMANAMPLLPSFPAVALVELRPREDVSETHLECLLAFATGRVLRVRGRGTPFAN